MRRSSYFFLLSALGLLTLVAISILAGPFSLTIPEDLFIFYRLSKTVTALLAGAALSVSGLLLQTYFRNPLASPFVLGVDSGSSLFVSVWILIGTTLGSFYTMLAPLSLPLVSLLGALSVLLLIVFLSKKYANKDAIIIVGLLSSYLVAGVINLFISLFAVEELRIYLTWGLGSFERVLPLQLLIYSVVLTVFLIFSFSLTKTLNLLLLGVDEARSLGVNYKKESRKILITAGALTAMVTAYCGPIGFISVIVPVTVRKILRTSNHRQLIAGSIILGASVAILCSILLSLFPTFSLSINALLGLVGAPLMMFLYLQQKERR